MVGTIQYVLEHPVQVKQVCERARTLIRDKVTIDNMVTNVDKAIRAAVARRGSKR